MAGVGLALLAMWGSIAYYLISARKDDIAAEARVLSRTTKAIEAQTYHLFTFVRFFLAAADVWLEAHPDADPLTSPEFQKYVEAFRNQTGGRIDIRFVSSEGGLFYLNKHDVEPVADVLDRDYFRAQFDPATRGLFIGKPVKSRVTGEWLLPISYPITSHAHSMAIILATFDARLMEQSFETSRSQPNGTVLLARRDGTILFRVPHGDAIGKSGASGYLWTKELPYRTEGTTELGASLVDGRPRVAAFSTVPGFPLVVLTSSATDDVLRAWRTKVWSAVIFGAIITLLSGFVLRRLLKALRAMETAGRQLARQANIDYLTQVPNRRYFTERGSQELRRAARHGRPLSAVVFDIDHFKRINDVHGHSIGDRVLQALSKAVHGRMRETDILGRLGGEEFGMLLPETGSAAALDAAERVRLCAAALKVRTDKGQLVPLTISCGVAQWSGAKEDLAALLKRADRALYEAKESGRNRVCVDGRKTTEPSPHG
jgi:diguanylate cyclase (GGDEF)-like protein